MTTTTFFDMSSRRQPATAGILCTIADGRVDMRHRQARRYITSIRSMTAADRPDVFELDRRSLFEGVAPERP